MENIKLNMIDIRNKIKSSAINANVDYNNILLLGVTKTIDVARIQYLIDLGVTDIGENKVQELLDKHKILGECVNYHFIGSLQTNKVKYIIDKVCLIHSLDSIRLADEINKQAKKINKIQDVLVEINIGDEETKHGIKEQEVIQFVDSIKNYTNIRVKGLMCVAPYVENPRDNAICFEKMKLLFIDINDKFTDNIDMKYLSMGMSNDYEVAIEHGANILRIGTGIFGKREYT